MSATTKTSVSKWTRGWLGCHKLRCFLSGRCGIDERFNIKLIAAGNLHLDRIIKLSNKMVHRLTTHHPTHICQIGNVSFVGVFLGLHAALASNKSLLFWLFTNVLACTITFHLFSAAEIVHFEYAVVELLRVKVVVLIRGSRESRPDVERGSRGSSRQGDLVRTLYKKPAVVHGESTIIIPIYLFLIIASISFATATLSCRIRSRSSDHRSQATTPCKQRNREISSSTGTPISSTGFARTCQPSRQSWETLIFFVVVTNSKS
jgi:hypothetical protein